MFHSTLKITDFDFSKPRVRFNGRVLDKCLLSSYIHDVAVMSGHSIFPLVSDIYWYSMSYNELREELYRFINIYSFKNK